MRGLLCAAAVALAFAPTAANACSGPCPIPLVWSIEALTVSPVPRDGGLAFRARAGVEACVDVLEPHLEIVVTHAGAPVSGHVERPGGAELIVFVPDDPWLPTATYVVSFTLDNAGLIGGESLECGASVVTEQFEFTTAESFSPPIPAVFAPLHLDSTWTVQNKLEGIACCPQEVPESDSSAGCELAYYFPDGACTYLWEETALSIEAAEHPVDPLLQGQLLYELIVDGELLGRSVDLDLLHAYRRTSACASVEAIHLGTRERVSSPVSCTPDALGEALGVHPRDVLDELACSDPMLCSGPSGWDVEECSPFDPEQWPTPPPPSREETVFATLCPGLDGAPPWAETDTGGTSSGDGTDGSTGADGTGESGATTSGGSTDGSDGCSCTLEGSPRGLAWIVLLAGMVGRRRRAGRA